MTADSAEATREMELFREFESLRQTVATHRQRALDAAVDYSYIGTTLERLQITYRSALDGPLGGAERVTYVGSGMGYLEGLRVEVEGCSPGVTSLGAPLERGVRVVAVAAAATDSSNAALGISAPCTCYQPHPRAIGVGQEELAEKLSAIDGPLAGVYRSAHESFLLDRNDVGRTALWQMRQVLDHLLGRLAPDDQVRESSYWTTKAGDRPQEVYRAERLEFIVHEYLHDPGVRSVLRTALGDLIRNYDRLNYAHERGNLDAARARDAFEVMDRAIQAVVAAFPEWPPQRSLPRV